jgi:hypothetical protein
VGSEEESGERRADRKGSGWETRKVLQSQAAGSNASHIPTIKRSLSRFHV